ncbi:EscU/YscU/HrcU family type III secretion system export apparatus switch protein [Pseudomonas sp. PCH199]|uniref:EscU/YscU/HrcU family type III secretion system export apparatus switch protein n=1 Tax=unclassified Pseudomonas TaxID=196821 RepID=UPI000BC8BB2A|nr:MULTISPECIES: EscU/YscU/HrcU family type III secretion system export apparatus switch protein [unclassified Pseudomonas]MCW8277991.1 EscU/YscU/HrcU family type III secretion system export apparatus switch protein [Pseudomonas sp. PCH199]PAM81688.1 flagellar biosynthesis protein FlhB [Pseudomonas sp. ERMR1:02]
MKAPNAPRQAIALKYDGTHAPTLTAKGDEELAEEILRIARDCEVPIYENPELVSLLARMELGDSIPEELYRTIAEIIAFAWNLKGRFPAGQDPDAPRVKKDVMERGENY